MSCAHDAFFLCETDHSVVQLFHSATAVKTNVWVVQERVTVLIYQRFAFSIPDRLNGLTKRTFCVFVIFLVLLWSEALKVVIFSCLLYHALGSASISTESNTLGFVLHSAWCNCNCLSLWHKFSFDCSLWFLWVGPHFFSILHESLLGQSWSLYFNLCRNVISVLLRTSNSPRLIKWVFKLMLNTNHCYCFLKSNIKSCCKFGLLSALC